MADLLGTKKSATLVAVPAAFLGALGIDREKMEDLEGGFCMDPTLFTILFN